MSSPSDHHVVVVGAGVIGLSSALVLSKQGYKVTIVARDTPADMHNQAFASPWAGANWTNFGGEDARQNEWEKRTFAHLISLIPLGLVQKQPWTSYDLENPFAAGPQWYDDFVKDVVEVPASELPAGVVSAKKYTTISLAPITYLPWLLSGLAEYDVKIIVKEVDSLAMAFAEVPGATRLVNCTALGAATLKDVMDGDVYPIRGQTVLIRCPWVNVGVSKKSSKEQPIYLISRPDGLAVAGGTYHVGSYDLEVDPKRGEEILQEVYSLLPELSHGQGWEKIDVIRHNVGLRPARHGGARMELEVKNFAGKDVPVVHAYGIGGAGYQSSWGMAENVVELMNKSL